MTNKIKFSGILAYLRQLFFRIFLILFILGIISPNFILAQDLYDWSNSPCKRYFYWKDNVVRTWAWAYNKWSIDKSTGKIIAGDVTEYGYPYPIVTRYFVSVMYWTGGQWRVNHSVDGPFLSVGEGEELPNSTNINPCYIWGQSHTCPNCTIQRQELIDRCNGEDQIAIWDFETCEGTCKEEVEKNQGSPPDQCH